MQPSRARRSVARWGRRWPLLLACLACDTLLGLEHGVPAPRRADAGSSALGGEGGDGGEGAGTAPSGGAAGGSAAAGTVASDTNGGDTHDDAGAGGTERAGASSGAGSSQGGSSHAGSTGAGAGTGGFAATAAGGAGKGGGGRGCSSSAACPNADPAHCAVTCSRQGICVTSALDADGDEHGDALCAAAPGDDCNDRLSSVAPGLAEVCDGLDNDCSGTRDLEDGLPLSGTNQTLWDEHGLSPSVAYSPEAGRFGVVYREAVDNPGEGKEIDEWLRYAFMDREGALTGSGAIDLDRALDAALAAGNGEFAFVWSDLTGVHFQLVEPGGTLVGSSVKLSTDDAPFVALTHAGQAGWTAFWQGEDGLYVRHVGPAGQLGPALFVTTGDTLPLQAVASGSNVLFLYWSAGSDGARFIPSSLVGGHLVHFGTSPARPTVGAQVAARADGFGTMARDGNQLVFKSFDENGDTRCGPIVLPESPFFFTIAASKAGYVLLSGPSLVEVSIDCVVLQHTTSLDDEIPGVPRAVGAGDDGFLVAWHTSEAPTSVGWRRFGPHFCD